MLQNGAECLPNPCAAILCQDNQVCAMNEAGEGVCMDVETMVGPIPENEAYNPCAATTCMRGWSCVPVDGKGMCIKEKYNPCAATTCLIGYKCVPKGGKGKCVKDKTYNPCAATTCLIGYTCVPEGDVGKCISACAAVRCRSGFKCVLSSRGRAKCTRRPKPVNPCKGKKCRKAFKCIAKGKKAKCVSKCVGVKCLSKRKPRCIVSRKGQPVCVRPKSRSML